MRRILSFSFPSKHSDFFGHRSRSCPLLLLGSLLLQSRSSLLDCLWVIHSGRAGCPQGGLSPTHTHTKLGNTIDAARTVWFLRWQGGVCFKSRLERGDSTGKMETSRPANAAACRYWSRSVPGAGSGSTPPRMRRRGSLSYFTRPPSEK